MSNSVPRAGTLVIGVGNEFRSDDGVGILIARRLRNRLPGDVRVVEASGDGGALLEALKAANSTILIDAVRSGAAPGTIHCIDAAREPLSGDLFHSSSHEFGVADAVEMARALGQLPASLTVYGVEGVNFAPGLMLSESVARAAEEVERQIALHLGAIP